MFLNQSDFAFLTLLSLYPHERHLMVDSKFGQPNLQDCHKRRKQEMQISFDVEIGEFWNYSQKLKKNSIVFCVAINELKLDLNARSCLKKRAIIILRI